MNNPTGKPVRAVVRLACAMADLTERAVGSLDAQSLEDLRCELQRGHDAAGGEIVRRLGIGGRDE